MIGPGGGVLAACVQEFGTIDCENVPGLEKIRAKTHHGIFYDNTNRLAGGFKICAVVQIQADDEELLSEYEGSWYRLEDVFDLLEETKNTISIMSLFLSGSLLILQTLRIKELEDKLSSNDRLSDI